MAACVDTIVHQHFTLHPQVVVSMPGTQQNFTQRTLSPLSPQYEDFKVIDLVLKDINKKMHYPVLTSQTKHAQIPPNTVSLLHGDLCPKVHSYIIFLQRDEQNGNILVSLNQQLETLKDDKYSDGRYRQDMMIVTTEIPLSLVKDLLEFLWQTKRIVNALILLQSSNTVENQIFDLYTWYPYESGHCGEVKDIVLLERWTAGKFSKNVRLFPNKIPNDFKGCPIHVAAIHYPPFVIMTESYTNMDGNTTYMFKGLEIEYLLLITAVMNIKVKFLPPIESNLVKLGKLHEGRADIVLGAFPTRFYQTIDEDVTKAYVYTSIKCFIPCPRPLPRTEDVTRVFMPSVWLAMSLVFILTAVLLWVTAKTTLDTNSVDATFYKTLHHCFYTAWAVFLGISAPAVPMNYQLRLFFLTFVWYCFAMNTVFQAFFISFFIQPGYEKEIQTIEELREAGIQDLVLDQFMKEFATDYEKAYCRDDECLVNMIEKHDFALKTSKHHMDYIASTIGITKNYHKYLCFLDDITGPVMYGMYLLKGNPLLNTINVLIQRCLEGGLGEKYWEELRWDAILKSKAKFMEHATANSETFFVFKLSHLRVAFSTLFLGCACSMAVFLAEVTLNCTRHWNNNVVNMKRIIK
jgi:hypothetical protein